MPCPQMKRCCCCFTVRTGTLIIGWISMIGAALGLIGKSGILGEKIAEDEVVSYTGLEGSTGLQIIAYCIGIFLAALLLGGVYMKKAEYLYFWVSVSIIGIVLFVILNIALLFSDDQGLQTTAVANLLGSLLQTYFILVVNSHAQEIKEYVQPEEPDV